LEFPPILVNWFKICYEDNSLTVAFDGLVNALDFLATCAHVATLHVHAVRSGKNLASSRLYTVWFKKPYIYTM
jgi:hypothetical protein